MSDTGTKCHGWEVLLAMAVGIAIGGWMATKGNGSDVDLLVNRAGVEACAPYQVITQFADRGHDLAVCRTEQGLVVREVFKETR